MGRNKKKSKANKVHSSDDEGSEDKEEVVADPPHEEAAAAEGAAVPEVAAADEKECSEKPESKKAEAEGEGEGEGEGDKPKRLEPVQVLYCPMCTFPAEMCEFAGMMDKCRPWLLEHAAELAACEDRGRRRRILTEKGRLDAMVEGRGVKKALERVVVIKLQPRGKQLDTHVYGMELFGHNMKDLSREWRKKFSCGGGVGSAEVGETQDFIQLQGNWEAQLGDLLVTKYKVPKESIYRLEKKKKVRMFE